MTRTPHAISLAVIAVLAALAGCDGGKPEYLTNPMAPAGSTPDQVRAFCTRLGDQAANWNYVSQDPSGPSLRARDQTFGSCMARHNIRP
jgi:hypothetical protein